MENFERRAPEVARHVFTTDINNAGFHLRKLVEAGEKDVVIIATSMAMDADPDLVQKDIEECRVQSAVANSYAPLSADPAYAAEVDKAMEALVRVGDPFDNKMLRVAKSIAWFRCVYPSVKVIQISNYDHLRPEDILSTTKADVVIRNDLGDFNLVHALVGVAGKLFPTILDAALCAKFEGHVHPKHIAIAQEAS